MNKNLAALTILAFLFCGWTWGGEKKKEEAPVVNKPVQKSTTSMPVQAKPVYSGYAAVPKQVVGSSAQKTPVAPLKSLTSGTEEERRKRMESLVRFSEAMKKKREAEAAAKRQY